MDASININHGCEVWVIYLESEYSASNKKKMNEKKRELIECIILPSLHFSISLFMLIRVTG